MWMPNAGRRRRRRQVLMALLILAYMGLGTYMNLVLRANVVYSHLAYIPVVLASMWWGRRGAAVAILLGGGILCFHLFGVAAGYLWNDVARAFFLVLVALCLGMLSDRIRTSERLMQVSEQKHRLIVENSLAGILVCEEEQILFANPRIGQMLGWRPTDIVGLSPWELIADEDRTRIRELTRREDARGPSGTRYECRFLHADGTRLWADVARSVAYLDGHPVVVIIAYDITGRKQVEAKRQELAESMRRQEEQLVHSTRLAELGEMSAAVAHDLNQPLTGIRNFAKNALYMLDEGFGSHEQIRDNLQWITEQVDRAAKIIDQMRGMTRKAERQFVPVDVNSVVRESVEFLTPQLQLPGVETKLELAPDLPEVMGGKIRLEQVFLNLLTNARQAMEESDTRRLRVRTYVDAADHAVVVEFQDTGKGFPLEQTKQIFAPFYTTKKSQHGTGLGLSISLRIIRNHGGTIEAVGDPGKGATFTVRLPLPKLIDTQGLEEE